MGLIQELTRFLEAIQDKSNVEAENERLQEQINELLKEKNNLQFDLDTQTLRKKNALDEVILCQKRIDALLRQLAEKNGGK